MHDLDKPYTDSIQQWDVACDCFKAEFKFDPNEIVTIDTIREMFAEIVDGHELSQNASISLMFALYFLGYVTLLEIMKAKDESFEIGDMADFYLILDRADQWAHQSLDSDKLAKAAAPIIQATQQIMQKLNLVR
ncbi:MAG: hypothetical protein RLZ00_1085 [Pseudomonadota bacterium]|jgi:hypothetical protein